MSAPYWIQDAIFYQIFPDRFANGDLTNDPPNVRPWNLAPTRDGFQGGDLRGVIQHFDYLLDLGINAIYLNPIFQATSTHRYNATDYYKIDPFLGDLRDFKALVDLAHQNGVRIILDGVFNHSGRGFFAFNDILENQEGSPYRDWYHIKHFPVDAYSPGDATDYLGWWKIKSLPKFNTDNPAVRKYLLGVAHYWIEQGADGWRLDVPNEIDDDHFWLQFRQTVKSANPDAYILGEIWQAGPRWVGDTHFDGLMNYPIRDAILGFLKGQSTASDCAEHLEKTLESYPHENSFAMYTPLSSHDTERVLTFLGDDVKKVELAMLLQFSYPGAPAIYYGDEIGLEGGKDPDSRRTFPWDQKRWKQGLQIWAKKLIHVRKTSAILRRGAYLPIWADNERAILAFGRVLGEDNLLVIVNASSTRKQFHLPVDKLAWRDGYSAHNLLDSGEFLVSEGKVSLVLPPLSGLILQ
jgi:cyclomaltodextrinase / maltogenic alpha-amylase / neopullulanase